MTEICALVAAAGRGSRAGLAYPKTLFKLHGKPILLRIIELLVPYDMSPTIIVSPDGEIPIRECLAAAQCDAHLVVQPVPNGMGDAVLRFEQSPAYDTAQHILLIWGDIPFIQPQTLASVVKAHLEHDNDFTFATRAVDAAYTVVSRDMAGRVTGVVETREAGITYPLSGERDIGLFMFRKQIVFPALREELPSKWGAKTGEHGFLYIIGHLANFGYKIEALPVATKMDLVSLNSMKDIRDFL
jgi:bifunctional UDP-N-acetylglucosamine pyrophosphorylase / glucosamine-1-phosphate N-acetyltransferase